MGTSLVARVPEVVTLDRLRAAAATGRGAVALLVGEAGIGKTALVEEAVARATAAGTPVLTGRADPDEGAPAFWPWLRLLDGAPAGLSPALLDVRDGAGESPAAARFRVRHATVRALRSAAAAGAGGLVLVLEDLQWADAASVALLADLARDLGAPADGTGRGGILVIATVRRPEGRFPVAEFAALPAAEMLPLEPLAVPAVGTYLTQQAGAPVHPSWTPLVHRLSGGNPLYIRELARLLSRTDRLRRPATDVDLPDGLRRLVSRRTAQLSAPCRDLLGGAAALGAEVDTGVLRDATPAPDAVEALLAEAVDAGVLTEDPWRPDRLRFAHDLVRRARYENLGRPERIGWHARLAAALATGGGTPAEVARHRVRAAVDAASRRTAVQACAAAARAAAHRLDHDEAVRWYGRALDLAPHDPALLLARAEAAYRDGRLDVALADCSAVLDTAESEGRPGLAAEAALVVRGLAGHLAPALLALCERALALLDGEDRAQVLAQYAFLLAGTGDHARAEPISREAMALAERSGRAGAIVAAVHARHAVLEPAADLDEVLRLADRSCALAAESGRPDAELWGRTWRIDALLMAGDLTAMDAETGRLAALVDRLGWPVARWHLLRTRAARLLLAGRLAEARTVAVEARDLALRGQDESAAPLYLAFATSLAMHTGRFDDLPGAGTLMPYLDMPIAAAQLGGLAMAQDDRELGERCWERLRPALSRLPVDGRRTFIVVSAGEIATWLGDRDTAAQCYERTLPHAGLYLNSTTACHGAVARALGVMAAALGDHDAADRHLAAAVAMEERIASPPFVAHALLAHARALLARGGAGDRRRAHHLADRAAEIARRLGMPPVRAAATAVADAASGVRGGVGALTAREREIALLVADGLANRAIAERLVLSERTVETHVRHVLAKLGLRNRTQVAAWAARLRTAPQ
jgi:DNA-binding NarL/FixJ family response regulator